MHGTGDCIASPLFLHQPPNHSWISSLMLIKQNSVLVHSQSVRSEALSRLNTSQREPLLGAQSRDLVHAAFANNHNTLVTYLLFDPSGLSVSYPWLVSLSFLLFGLLCKWGRGKGKQIKAPAVPSLLQTAAGGRGKEVAQKQGFLALSLAIPVYLNGCHKMLMIKMSSNIKM